MAYLCYTLKIRGNNMHNTAKINARINPLLKSKAEKILHHAGLSSADAIRLFYTQICLQHGLPFEIKIPNKTTQKIFEETDKKIGVVKCKNVEDLFKKLGI
jgi:DNA-damage-inducible protein J